MNAFGCTLSSLALLSSFSLHAQFTAQDIRYWVGSGTDSTVLVVDFQDGTEDHSYAWGFLHNTATAEDMLNAIAAADVNFTVNITGGFLNDIAYNTHVGNGGAPEYWSTWSGTTMADLVTNSGISEPLGTGDLFGCSYTDFDPALIPTGPIAAFDPFRFTAEDVDVWVGSGQDTAVLVIDFQDGSAIPSYAWGYLYSGTVTGETMLNDIAAADPDLDVVIDGGFLMNITYNGHAGLYNSPNYWSTWSGTNLGNWTLNMGVSATLNNGDLFGCSYTDFAPALRPGYPAPAEVAAAVVERSTTSFEVFPQPAADVLWVNTPTADRAAIVAYTLSGKVVLRTTTHGLSTAVEVSGLAAGMYVLQVGTARRTIVVR